MVKIQKRRSAKALKLKKLTEQVPLAKYRKLQDEELRLYEEDNEQPQQQSQEENDLGDSHQAVQSAPPQQQPSKWEDVHDSKIQIDLSKVARMRKFIRNGESIISGAEYQRRLREFYSKRSSAFYTWTQGKQLRQDDDAESSEQPEIKTYRSNLLQPRVLAIEQAGIIKKQINSVIQSISFHPKLPLFAVGAFDKVLRIFNINPKKQIELVKSIALEKFPISKAVFMQNSDLIVGSSFKSHLLCINYQTQKVTRIRSTLYGEFNKQINFALSANNKHLAIYNDSGTVQIHDGRSKLFLFQVKQNEACTAVTFSDLYLYTGGNKLYQWNLETRQIEHIYHNPGGFEILSIDARLDLLAVGCKTGIVNVYRSEDGRLKLQKEIQNLTTSVDQVQMNQFAELLCISSKWKANAIRLVHVDSLTVFENWPKKQDFLKKVSAVGISADSRFLIVGNEDGDLRGYRLLHY